METFICTKLEVGLPEVDGQDNALMTELGPQFSNALFDLFIHPAGSRARDRISHGEAMISRVSKPLVDRFLSLYLALAIYYSDHRLTNPGLHSHSFHYWNLTFLCEQVTWIPSHPGCANVTASISDI